MEELQSHLSDMTMEIMNQQNHLGAIRKKGLLHSGHVLAEFVTLGRRDGRLGLLVRPREDAADVHSEGLSVKAQESRVRGFVQRDVT
eukprot:5008845-Amphidinium_carterae.1